MYATVDEFKKIISGDLNTLNEVLSRVHNRAVEDAIRMTPELAARLLKNTSAIVGMLDSFNKAHPEFKGHEDVVRKVLQDVESENPGDSYDRILEKAAPRITNLISNTSMQPVPGTQLSLGDLNNKLF